MRLFPPVAIRGIHVCHQLRSLGRSLCIEGSAEHIYIYILCLFLNVGYKIC